MTEELEAIRIELKELILNNCNTIGCDNCSLKFIDETTKKDSCQQEVLMNKEFMEVTKNV